MSRPSNPYRNVEPRGSAAVTAPGWGEDLLLAGLFASVGGLGVAAGILADSAVQGSIGLVLVLFAVKVLLDILACRRRASPSRSEDVSDVRPAPR